MNIAEILKKQGYSITKPREEILKVIKDYPRTVKEIHTDLQANGNKVDLASVYRSLNLFVKIGVIQAVDLGEDEKRYELLDEEHHHHHLVCNSCGLIDDVEIDEEKVFTEISRKLDFRIQKHTLEFFGLCKNCQ